MLMTGFMRNWKFCYFYDLQIPTYGDKKHISLMESQIRPNRIEMGYFYSNDVMLG